MSMSSGEFTAVTFGAMSQAEADFASVYQALQNTLNTLDSELQLQPDRVDRRSSAGLFRGEATMGRRRGRHGYRSELSWAG